MPSTKTKRSYTTTKDSFGKVTLIRNGSKYEKNAQKRASMPHLAGQKRKFAIKGTRATQGDFATADAIKQGNYKKKVKKGK